jgi:hypothetical protein
MHVQQAALRNALISTAKGKALTAVQRRAVREIGEMARELNQSPEQSLIAFKAGLRDAADAANILPGRDRSDLLDRFVSLFIEEMFRSEPRSREDGAGRGSPIGGISPATSSGSPEARL